jgi:hypothetical protein
LTNTLLEYLEHLGGTALIGHPWLGKIRRLQMDGWWWSQQQGKRLKTEHPYF